MKSGSKIWSTVVDYFLILGAVIGVGFASGKEICVFFFDFGKFSLLGLVAFSLLYIYLFYIIEYIGRKLKLNTYDEFTAKMFGKLNKFTNIIILLNFAITSAGMFAGIDYLFETFVGVGYKIPSTILAMIVFVVMTGGIDKIRVATNIVTPIMIATIVINAFKNITPANVHFEIVGESAFMAVYFGLLFGVNNFIAAMPIIFEMKQSKIGKLVTIFSIVIIILLNILVFASNGFSTDMPMFELSKNVSHEFYYIYFVTIVLALFSTVLICSFNMQKIMFGLLKLKKKSIFLSLMIVIINLIISNIGYSNIVKYLYVVSGIISGVYVLILIVSITISLIKLNKNQKIIEN